MSLDQLQSDVNMSLKKGDSVRVGTLRFLISAVRNYAIATYGNAWETSLKEEDILDVIKKQVKTHKESVAAFTKAGRSDLSVKEQQELDVLQAFLPSELSDSDLKIMLSDVVSGGDVSNFGLLMKSAMAKVQGKADGGRVSAILKQLLQEKQV
jgi:hypothetical protein